VDYSNNDLINDVETHSSTTAFINDINTQIKNQLLSGKTMVELYGFISVNKPVYSLNHPLAFCIHGTQYARVSITSYSVTGTNYSASLHIVLKDVFGLATDDITRPTGWLDGFFSWYVLQHYDGYNGAHKPFITVIEFDTIVSGTL
jgi:hypothetical protein